MDMTLPLDAPISSPTDTATSDTRSVADSENLLLRAITDRIPARLAYYDKALVE